MFVFSKGCGPDHSTNTTDAQGSWDITVSNPKSVKGQRNTPANRQLQQCDKCWEGKYRMLLSHKQGATNQGSRLMGGGSIRQGLVEEMTYDLRLDSYLRVSQVK